MPVATTYPGVYVEEIPSGVRPITGVATAIAAFVGWAPKGPLDRAELVLSYEDFRRKFGGIHPESLLGYAVNHFFLNGGQRAYVIRLAREGSGTSDAASATATVSSLALRFTAKSPGDWAEGIEVGVKSLPLDPSTGNPRYTISFQRPIPDTAPVQYEIIEKFANVQVSDPTGARYVKDVIEARSEIAGEVDVLTTAATDAPTFAGGNNGTVLQPNSSSGIFETLLTETSDRGLCLLDKVDLFNLLCVPGETTVATQQKLQTFCRERRAFYIADCPENGDFDSLQPGPANQLVGVDSRNSAYYCPWLKTRDPLRGGLPKVVPPCGFVAGIYARTDTERGVWKAPAGIEATLVGATEACVPLSDDQNGVLNPQAINCIRSFENYGIVVWGARTLDGDDDKGSEWKYIPIRRLALFIEETLYRALHWVVFEPNDEPLWAQIRLNVRAFMHNLFRQGAFQGQKPKDAYFVKCDGETTTETDRNLGRVNILVGFAPLKPAEFVVIQLQQMTAESQV